MLDGRVLGASEQNPFGKPPLKRELELSAVGDSTSHCGQRGQPDLLHAKPLNPHSPQNVLYVLYYSVRAKISSICAIWPYIAHIAHIARIPGRVDVQWLAL